MSRFINHEKFDHTQPGITGVLLLNLGTPDAPTAAALRRYLAEFLSDPRIVEMPRLLWMLILHGVVLRLRPKKSAHAYQQIWTEQGSPLLVTSRRFTEKLQQQLQQQLGEYILVELAMRYGNPAIETTIERMQQQGVRRLLVVPMYPQYAGSSTASACDAVFDVMKKLRWQPELRVIQHYHDHPDYITALKNSVESYWNQYGRGKRLLLSFHGVPRFHLDKGDPYHCECHTTARLLRAALGLTDEDCLLAFQSRFGKAEWLKPYTSETLSALANNGDTDVDVLCPGFAVDCLETLEEITMQNRDVFCEAGGKSLRYIPALNDSKDHVQLYMKLIMQHTQGWPQAAMPDHDMANGFAERANLLKKST